MTATRLNHVAVSRTNLCSCSWRTRHAKVGRPSKGPRRTIGVPVPMPLADRIARIKELTGKTMGEIVIEVLERHVDEPRPAIYEVGAAQPRMDLDESERTA